MDRAEESYRRLHATLWRSLLVSSGDLSTADAVEIDTFVAVVELSREGGLDECPSAGDVDSVDEDAGFGGLTGFDVLVWTKAFELISEARLSDRELVGAVTSGRGPSTVTLIDTDAYPDALTTADILQPLESMSDRARAIVALTSVAGLDASQIAEVLSIPLDEAEAEIEYLAQFPQYRTVADRLADVDAPDLWPSIAERLRPPSAARSRNRRIATAVSIMVLAVLGFGVFRLAEPTAVAPVSTEQNSRGGAGAPVDRVGSDPGAENSDQRPTVQPRVTGEPLRLVSGEDGAAVYDIRLPSGERFRLSVPARLQPELDTVIPQIPPGVIRITGPGRTDLRIGFTFCADQDQMVMNGLGSAVGRLGDGESSTVTFCRPDELLVTTVSTELDLDDEELRAFDLRPIELGPSYVRHRSRFLGTPMLQGPVRFGSVVVNASGPTRIAAVDANNLSTRWTFESDPAEGRDVDLTLLAPSVADSSVVDGIRSDAEGVWVSESGRGVVNLDPRTGDRRWQLDTAASAGGVWGVGGEPWFVWSSYDGEGDDRAPLLQRVDPEAGAVLWEAEGRPGADWGWNPFAVSDDQVFIADVFSALDRPTDGAGSSILAFDIESGESDFEVTLDAPAAEWTTAELLQVLTIDDQAVLLSSTTHGLLSVIDLPGGELRWSRPINPGVLLGSVLTDGDGWALRVQSSPTGPYYLSVADGQRIADVELPAPPPACRTQYGSVGWVTLWRPEEFDSGDNDSTAATPAPDCVVVAESQELQILNKGFDPMTLSWGERRERVPSDGSIELSPAGRSFPLGPTVIDVEPYADLTVWVMAAEASPTVAYRLSGERYGPIEVGMTVADASAALGRDLELIAHDTSSGCVVVSGDPYSPLFRSEASAAGLLITAVGADCPE